MSLLDTFTEGCADDAFNIIGTAGFTISGIDGEFAGVLNEFTSERELTMGGKVGTYTATLVISRREIAAEVDQPIERALTGRSVTCEGRVFKVASVEQDSVFVTLGLENETK
jgi:hypothetical protein